MKPFRTYMLIVAAVLSLVGGALVIFINVQFAQLIPQHATVLPSPLALPNFALTDGAGQIFDRDSLRGEWHLVFFGFTHCPDICPATLQQLAIARDKVNAMEGEGSKVFPQIILISVDPERDSPATMREYVANFGNGITGVTGDIDELRKLTSAFGIFFEKVTTEGAVEGDNYDVAHSAVVLLINPQAEFHALFSAPHNVEHFVKDVPIITGSTASN